MAFGKNQYYIYSYLREDHSPYYIGKGSGKRAYTKGPKEVKPPRDKSRVIIIKDLIRIKVNCNPRTFFKTNTGFHMDTEFSNVKTAVYYINTNNGGTKIKDGPFIKSVGNRVAIFDSNVLHAGVTCTDRNVRILINVNYT